MGYVLNDPVNRIDPFGLFESEKKTNFRNHGNYCGPNYCGGQTLKKCEKCDYGVTPEDSMDNCCYAHDKCYDDNGLFPESLPNDHGRMICDQELLNCLNQLPGDPDRWRDPPIVNPNIPKWRPGIPYEYDRARKYRSAATYIFKKRVSESKRFMKEK